MAFAWDVFAEQIGRTTERTAGTIRQQAVEKDRAEQLEARAMNLAKLRKQLDFDALKQELKFKSSWDGLQYSIGQDLSGMPPNMAKQVQLSVLMARTGHEVPLESFSNLSELNQAKISEVLYSNRMKNAELKLKQDRVKTEAERIEAFRERTRAYGREDLMKIEAEEEKGIEKRTKRLQEKSKTLIKNALFRLNNEKAILVSKSKPSQYETTAGALSAVKKGFAEQLENVENAIDFVSKAGSTISGGAPLRDSVEATVKALTSDIKKLRSGETLKSYWTKMKKQLAEDEYGFSIGEEREANGILYKYVGEDKWVPVK